MRSAFSTIRGMLSDNHCRNIGRSNSATVSSSVRSGASSGSDEELSIAESGSTGGTTIPAGAFAESTGFAVPIAAESMARASTCGSTAASTGEAGKGGAGRGGVSRAAGGRSTGPASAVGAGAGAKNFGASGSFGLTGA